MLLSLLFLSACGLFDRDPPPAPPPAPPPEAAPVVEAAPVTPTEITSEWPLWPTSRIPVDASFSLPAGSRLRDLDLDPQGRRALLLLESAEGTSAWSWDFVGAPYALSTEGRAFHELESSPLRDEVFAITKEEGTSGQGAWTVARYKVAAGSLLPVGPVLVADAALSDLVAPALMYAPWTTVPNTDRIFVARQSGDGSRRILSVMASGARAYEVTSPTGTLSELSDPTIRTPAEYEHGPRVLPATWARPLGVDPFTGELLWADAANAVHGLAWTTYGGENPATWNNWGEDRTRATDELWSITPNGRFRLGWRAGRAGVRLLDREGAELAVLAAGHTFAEAPRLSADGRTLVGAVIESGATVLRTIEAGNALLTMRYLDQSSVSADEQKVLVQRGIQVQPTTHDQLYRIYEEFAYASPEEGGPPVFASIDGTLEVLHAGFEAVFLRVELEASRPALGKVFTALTTLGQREGLGRLREIGAVGSKLLEGDYAHAEGQRILAETTAVSDLHGVPVEYADFKPRGPYAARTALSHYFRAFKFLNLLALTDEEKAAVQADPELVSALSTWRATQAAMVYPSRSPALLQADFSLPGHVQADCISERVQKAPPRPFALSWGIDSEILQLTVQQLTDDERNALTGGRTWAEIDADASLKRTPRHCTVRDRLRPSGLDLLVGLGASHARTWMAGEYLANPELSSAHDRLAARFSGPVDTRTIAGSWLRLVQLLGTDAAVPKGVDPTLWRARLAETALASWTGFRHTTVLLQETTAAQAGGGGEGFERLLVEPGRGVVDPVPQAWAALAETLQSLARHGGSAGTDDRLVEVLTEASASARALGDMATRQMRGEALTREEYESILWYVRAIEHPFLLLKSSVPEDGALAGPSPMAKIVDIHSWTDESGQTRIWHSAIGNPQKILVLGSDRGVLVPARGGVYSWYEAVANSPLDDAAWRSQVDTAPRPDWVVASRK